MPLRQYRRINRIPPSPDGAHLDFPTRQVATSLALIIAILLIGTCGYHLIEGVPLFDAFYFTVITVSTIGYSEPSNFSEAGRAFTIGLVIFNLIIFTYAATTLGQFLVSGVLMNKYGARKMRREIERLEDHYIVCGYSRLGRMVIDQLLAYDRPLLVIDTDRECCDEMTNRGILNIQGDASEDRILNDAGINRAAAVIVVAQDDPINVYITLSARALNPDVTIIAQGMGDLAENKLKRAGASRVVSPLERGAIYISQAALRPSVVDFLDMTATPGGEKIQLEELEVPAKSPLAEKTLRQLDLGHRFSIIVAAIHRSKEEGWLEFNPGADSKVQVGDVLVALGRYEDLRALEQEMGD
ncbi:potassium channel protein [bacterium]|nr:potassium channel protein [bacterium]